MKKSLLIAVVAALALTAPVHAMQDGGAGYERNAFERSWDAFNDFIDRTGSALGDYLGAVGGQPIAKDFNKAKRAYVGKHGTSAWYKLSHWETLELASQARSDRLGKTGVKANDARTGTGSGCGACGSSGNSEKD